MNIFISAFPTPPSIWWDETKPMIQSLSQITWQKPCGRFQDLIHECWCLFNPSLCDCSMYLQTCGFVKWNELNKNPIIANFRGKLDSFVFIQTLNICKCFPTLKIEPHIINQAKTHYQRTQINRTKNSSPSERADKVKSIHFVSLTFSMIWIFCVNCVYNSNWQNENIGRETILFFFRVLLVSYTIDLIVTRLIYK